MRDTYTEALKNYDANGDGELDVEEIQQAYDKTLERYTEEGEKENFLNIINEYKNERINELEGLKK